MAKDFKTFNRLNEKLGRIEQVEHITDVVWEKYKNADTSKNFIMTNLESGDFKIDLLMIQYYYDPYDELVMGFSRESNIDKFGNYNVFLFQNTDSKKNKEALHHELVHAYDYYKRKFNKPVKFDKEFKYLQLMRKLNEDINRFVHIMNIIQNKEIISLYNESIMFIKENKNKFRKFKYILKACPLVVIYDAIKDYDIKNELEMDEDVIVCFIEKFYELRREEKIESGKKDLNYYKRKFLKNLKLKNYEINITENEKQAFFRKFQNELEFKKKIYLKYIGRLRTIFEEDFDKMKEKR